MSETNGQSRFSYLIKRSKTDCGFPMMIYYHVHWFDIHFDWQFCKNTSTKTDWRFCWVVRFEWCSIHSGVQTLNQKNYFYSWFIISVNSLLDKMLIKFHYNWLLIYFLLQKFLKNSWRKYVLRLEWNDFLHYANAKINYCSLVFIFYYGVQLQKNRPIEAFSNEIRLRIVNSYTIACILSLIWT